MGSFLFLSNGNLLKMWLFESFQNNNLPNLWWTPLMPPSKIESRPIATFVFFLTSQNSSIRWRSKNSVCRRGVSNLYYEIYRCTIAACMVVCGYYTYAVMPYGRLSALVDYQYRIGNDKKKENVFLSQSSIRIIKRKILLCVRFHRNRFRFPGLVEISRIIFYSGTIPVLSSDEVYRTNESL